MLPFCSEMELQGLQYLHMQSVYNLTVYIIQGFLQDKHRHRVDRVRKEVKPIYMSIIELGLQ
jgi:hypothetical protein